MTFNNALSHIRGLEKITDALGVGTDIENIDRFSKANSHLLNKIFTEKELKYCQSKKYPEQHLAGRFTGKEAVIKAVSSAFGQTLTPKDIEILNDENGVPKVKLPSMKIKLSISHCDDKALAFAIATGEK